MLAIIIFVVALALIFDFLNGMNDAANSVATIVATRVLTPIQAVAWAAFFNFAAVFIFGVHVANTIGRGIINPEIVNTSLIFVTLVSAITWTHFCTRMGLPISVSHSLVGGLLGSAIAKEGFGAVIYSGVGKIAVFIVLSPVIGMLLAYIIMIIVYRLCANIEHRKVNRWFKKMQLISAALYSLGHGTNDAQKTMGIIAILLYSEGLLGPEFYVPFWVILSCYTAIAMGTLMGGWRVVQTLGMKMTKLEPVHGFSAETAAATSILFSSVIGVPVSTTHTITGAIIGVGATTKFSSIRWGLAYKILWAWILTLPCTALFSALCWYAFVFVKGLTVN